MTQSTAPDGGITRFEFDANGSLLKLTDPKGRMRRWAYNVRQQVVSATDALGRLTQFSYDAVGNVETVTRPDGKVISMTYNAANELIRKNLPALPGVPADVVDFDFDGMGRLIGMADNDSEIINTFDDASRLIQAEQVFGGNGQAISYGYDIVSRRTSMTDPTGNTTYGYDSLDRLNSLQDPSARVFGFGYDTISRLTSLTRNNGVNSTFNYDNASQLLSMVHQKAAVTLASANYTYNLVGNRNTETREDAITRTFGYDGKDRVLTANSSLPANVPNESFNYDLQGNWTVDSRVHNAMDELVSDANFTYTYDLLGNLVQKVAAGNPSDVTTYTYNAENRLIGVTTPAVATTYVYDPIGRRIARV